MMESPINLKARCETHRREEAVARLFTHHSRFDPSQERPDFVLLLMDVSSSLRSRARRILTSVATLGLVRTPSGMGDVGATLGQLNGVLESGGFRVLRVLNGSGTMRPDGADAVMILLRGTEARLHREFYSGIRKFLAPGARMYIEEVRPMDRLVHHCVIRSTDGVWVRSKEPCDERSAAPLPLFASMIADGGLRLIQTLPWVDERSRLVPAHRREGLREAVSWILVVAADEPARRRGAAALVEGLNL